ncbi:MAG: RNA polymerase sigma factor [Phycisphaeraceae bacterium JB051]
MGEMDRQLLDEFSRCGSEIAFARLVNRYSALVYSASYRVLNNHAQAEEVCQETFFKLLNHSRQITTSLSGWLYQTAVRISIDMIRSDRARSNREQNYAHDQFKASQQVTSWKQLESHLDEALDLLPDDQRDLLVEHFLQGISQRQIAAKHGWSTATTHRHIKHAIEKLREQLSEKHLSVAALPAILGSYSHMVVPPELSMKLGKMALASGYAQATITGVPKIVLLWGSINKVWLILALVTAMTLGILAWRLADRQASPASEAPPAIQSPRD